MWEIGDMIQERYCVRSFLGQGGMGSVYLVEDQQSPKNPLRALKILVPPKSPKKTSLQTLQQEFRVLKELRHPYLARVYDLSLQHQKGPAFFTSEYIEGTSLKSLLNTLSFPEKIQLAQKVIESIHYIHKKGVIHNDIKCSNFIIDNKTNNPILIDFGLSHKMNRKNKENNSSIIAGTTGYIPPEIYQYGSYSQASDIFSLGVVYFFLFTGHFPFDDLNNPREVMQKTLKGQYRNPKELNPDLPTVLADMILRCLHSDSNQRPSLQELKSSFSEQLPDTPPALPLFQESAVVIAKQSIIAEIKRDVANHTCDNPTVILIEGPKGTGKSFTLNHLKQIFQLKEFLFIDIFGKHENHGFGTWLTILQKIGGNAPESLKKDTQDLIEFLSPSTSKFSSRWNDATDLFLSIQNLLSRYYQTTPYILCIDDIDHLGPSSRALLNHLISHPVAHSPIILATQTPNDSKQTQKRPSSVILKTIQDFTDTQSLFYLKSLFFNKSIDKSFSKKIAKEARLNPEKIYAYTQFLVNQNVVNIDSSGQISLSKKGLQYRIEDCLPSAQMDSLTKEAKIILGFFLTWGKPVKRELLEKLLLSSPSSLPKNINKLKQLGIIETLADNRLALRNRNTLDPVQKKLALPKKILQKCVKLSINQNNPDHFQIAKIYTKLNNPVKVCEHALTAAKNLIQKHAHKESIRIVHFILDHVHFSQEISSLDHYFRYFYYLLAQNYWRLGDRNKALEYDLALIEKVNHWNTPSEFIESFFRLGIAKRDKGQFKESLSYFSTGLKDLNLKNSDHQVLSLNFMIQIAILEINQNHIEQAQEWLQKSISQLNHLIADPNDLGEIHARIGNIYLRLNEHDPALEHLNLAKNHFSQTGNKRGQAMAYNNLASVWARRQNYEKAESQFQKSLDLYEKTHDFVNQANTLFYLANIDFLNGHYIQATNLYRNALKIAKAMDHKNLIGNIFAALSQLSLERGFPDVALRQMRFALKIRKKSKNQEQIIATYLIFLNFFTEINHGKGFQKYLEKIDTLDTGQHLTQRKFFLQAYWEHTHPPYEDHLIQSFLETYPADLSGKLLHLKHLKKQKKPLLLLCQKYKEDFLTSSNKTLKSSFRLLEIENTPQEDEPSLTSQINELIALSSNSENLNLRINSLYLLYKIYERQKKTSTGLPYLEQAYCLIKGFEKRLEKSLKKGYVERSDIKEIITSYHRFKSKHEKIENMDSNLQKHLLKILKYNVDLASNITNIKKLIHLCLKGAMELCPAQRSFFIRHNSGKTRLIERLSQNYKIFWNPKDHLNTKIIDKCLRINKPVFHHDPDSTDFSSSILVVPVLLQDKCYGLLYLEQENIEQTISNTDIQIAQQFSTQVALAISFHHLIQSNNRYHEQTTQELSKTFLLLAEQQNHLQQTYQFHSIVGGKDPAMKKIFQLLRKASKAESTISILGETGTGKELIAQAIHYESPRKDHPFLAINCATFPEHLLESELFGYQKGAFTGAHNDKMGLFELAHKGTLFLDEVHEIPLKLQAKLLRFLQEREFRPLGCAKTRKVDIRIVAACNQNLQILVEKGTFREDLFYRLNVIQISLPPLRERKQDLTLLIQHFLEFANRPLPKTKHYQLSKEALRILRNYSWPGNVRELQHAIESATAISSGKTIHPKDLPSPIYKAPSPAFQSFEKAKNQFHKDYLTQLMQDTQGRIKVAAQKAGLSREYLGKLLKKHRIKTS